MDLLKIWLDLRVFLTNSTPQKTYCKYYRVCPKFPGEIHHATVRVRRRFWPAGGLKLLGADNHVSAQYGSGYPEKTTSVDLHGFPH